MTLKQAIKIYSLVDCLTAAKMRARYASNGGNAVQAVTDELNRAYLGPNHGPDVPGEKVKL